MEATRARSSLALATVAILIAACAGRDPHPDETQQRIAALEQKIAEQQRTIDELKAQGEAGPAPAPVPPAEPAPPADPPTTAIAAPPAPGQGTPDRSAVYSVPLGPSPVLGSPKAQVTMVMAGEFACPFCRKAWDTVEELRKTYGSDLRVGYKSFIVHPRYAMNAALAACAAHRQRKFKPMADLLWVKAFDAQDDPHSFDRENIDRIAAEAGLDMKRYTADMNGTCPAEVQADQQEMLRLGVVGTPTFFINGRVLSGAQPIGTFTVLIDEERAKANTAIKSGVKPERYYDQEIVAKGLKQVASSDLHTNPY